MIIIAITLQIKFAHCYGSIWIDIYHRKNIKEIICEETMIENVAGFLDHNLPRI